MDFDFLNQGEMGDAPQGQMNLKIKTTMMLHFRKLVLDCT
jgi:hypothetical protein